MSFFIFPTAAIPCFVERRPEKLDGDVDIFKVFREIVCVGNGDPDDACRFDIRRELHELVFHAVEHEQVVIEQNAIDEYAFVPNEAGAIG